MKIDSARMTPRTLAERYELSSKIGSGGMGTVWRAKDKTLDRDVAVKILHEGLASDAIFAERFRREAKAAASLAHPNVVTVYDTGEDDGIPFIVMECHDGESLHTRLHRDGALPAEDTARIGRSVLAALGHAHSRGLVHRDMKPANVLLDTTTNEAKVVDFGIAKGIEDTGGGLTRTSGLIGTAAYLSPEQVSGKNATPASDLYAVGCLLYACLVGEPPFGGGSPVAVAMAHVRDHVPPLRDRRPDVPAGSRSRDHARARKGPRPALRLGRGDGRCHRRHRARHDAGKRARALRRADGGSDRPCLLGTHGRAGARVREPR